MAPRGRGRLSSIDLMPEQASPIIAWASQELASLDRTQAEIYDDFVERCEALMAEHRGEIEFDIPSMSSFNRYSMRQARLLRTRNETRNIVSALSDTFSAKESDDLSILTAETIKTLVFHLVADAADGGVDPKDAMHMANAFKATVQAEIISTDRKEKKDRQQAEAAAVSKAIETTAKAAGMSADTVAKIKGDILGVAS